jgi:Ribbon-helix-helix domain
MQDFLDGFRLRANPRLRLISEEAVRWRVFHRTVQSIKDQNADTDPDELQRLIDSAARQVRAERGVKGKARKA